MNIDHKSVFLNSQTGEETDARLDEQREYHSAYLESQTDEQTAKRFDSRGNMIVC